MKQGVDLEMYSGYHSIIGKVQCLLLIDKINMNQEDVHKDLINTCCGHSLCGNCFVEHVQLSQRM